MPGNLPDLSPDQWNRARALFDEAVCLPLAERSAYLERHCGDDHELCRAVEALLEADVAPSGIVDASLSDLSRLLPDEEGALQVRPGDMVGRYHVLAEIGRGGMGVVYQADDPRLERFVALKFLPGDPGDADRVHRLLTEARTLAALDHPNIATVYEIDVTSDGRWFMAMAYYEGETLAQRLERGALSRGEALRIASGIARGLAAAHDHGVVHRDIKPGNVVLRNDGEPMLVDFGIAGLTGSAEGTSGPGRGTVAYMSPERVAGAPAEARADVWALGVVLYEMLAGRRPFEGETTDQVMAQIRAAEPPVLPPRVGRDLARVVGRALTRDPAGRFSDARQMLGHLQRCARRRRHGRRLAFVIVGLAGIALAGAFLFSGGGGPGHSSSTTVEGPGTALPAAAAVMPVGEDPPPTTAWSIAVLPFVNVGNDPEKEYFSDGLTEELIAALSRLRAVRVAARTSAFAFKGEKRDIRDIGRALKVATVLEGSVRLEKDRFRITARLTNVADGFQLWSNTYERRWTDLLEVQAELAIQIADALEAELTPAERAVPRRAPTENLEAYTHYLKGRFFWNKRTQAGFERALEHFQQALQLDPDYTLAYTGLADTYILLGYYSILPPHGAYPKAKAAALEALRIDSTLAEAHSSLAGVFMDYEWSWEDVEREYRLALRFNASYAVAHQWYGNYLIAMGRRQDAIRETLLARQLDPLSLIVNTNVGWVYHLARQHDRAIEEGRRALEMDPNFYWSYLLLGRAHEQKGELDEAIAAFETASTLSGRNSMVLAELGHVYGLAARRTDAERILATLLRPSEGGYTSSYDIALVHLGLGERDEAIDWLEKSYRERARALGFAKVEPRLDPLRSDPRFQELLRKMTFPGDPSRGWLPD